MDLSIVTTLYYSAPYLEEFYARITREAEKITPDYEVIFVNDGSPDSSSEIVLSFIEEKRSSKARLVNLSRNFGHHRALITGLKYATGNLVFLIDCDLEEEPELLSYFYSTMRNSKLETDVVYGIQTIRKGAWFERISGQLFWQLLSFLSSHNIAPNQLTARLMTQRYVASFLHHQEKEVFLAGLFACAGFHQVPVKVKKHFKGTTAYTFWKKIALFINAITSFSEFPLILNFYVGITITTLSLLTSLILVIVKLFVYDFLLGWPSVILSIWFLGGVTISSIGIVGIYLSKVFLETKNRPLAIVRDVYNFSHESEKYLKQDKLFTRPVDLYSTFH